MLLVTALLCMSGSVWAQVSVPTPVYFNDFSSTTGLEIIGNGEFITDADPAFGKVFHNDPANTSAIRTNYLKLPADVLSHSATSQEMTIGFWVNKKGEDNFFWTSLFAAYGAAPSGTNGAPMFVCETRGLIQLNCDGWCDFGINGGGTEFNDGTPYVNTVWLDDGAWHYYTVTLTGTKAKVYVDGELKNGWTVDGTSDGQKISGLFTSGSSLSYVTLGGNQAWNWGDPDPAFAFDDFAVYDKALSAEQIATIISEKSKAASTYSITYDFKNFVAEGTTSGNLSKGSNPAVGETNNTRSVYYPTTYVEGFCGRIAMNFSTERWSISNTDNDKGLIWNQGADEYFSILGLKAGDKVTINTTSGTIYFSTKGNCTGTYYSGDKFVNTETGIPAQWTQLVSGNTYTILADGQLNLQAKKNNGVAGRAQTREKLVISSIVIIPSQAETVSAPTISSEAADGCRNVTITSGTSDMLSGVSTYYTTDESIPTAQSTLYTGPFNVSKKTTVKAVTISNSSAATASDVTEQLIDLEVVDAPVLTVTGTNNNSRIVTITCATDGATIYYSENEKTNSEDGWLTYFDPVTTSATTLYAYAEKGSTKSDVANIATGAGTTIQLNAPVVSFSKLVLNTNVYNPVYTFTAPQSVLGNPEATISYSFESAASVEGTSYTGTAAGTLTVTASAAGYESKSTDFIISNARYGIVKVLDLSDDDYVDVSGWEGETTGRWANFTGMSATIYPMPSTTSLPGMTISNTSNTQFAVGVGLGISSGTRTVTLADTEAGQIGEFILYTGGSLDDAKNYSEFIPYSSGISFVVPLTKVSQALKKVIVYEPIPVNATATLDNNGYATFAAPYALDLANLPAGLKAYQATSVDGVNIRFDEVTKAVQANTGLLMEGTADESYNIPVVASGNDISATNLLKVNADGTVFSGETNHTYYAMMKNTYPLVFATFDPSTLAFPATKAYLDLTGGSNARLNALFGDDEATGVKDELKVNSENTWYTLDGRKLAKNGSLKKGLYVVDGKKVVIK